MSRTRSTTVTQIMAVAEQIGCSTWVVRKMIDVGGLNRDQDGVFLTEDIEFNRLFWEYNVALRSAVGYGLRDREEIE